jgi:Holliday junction resolvase
MTPEGRAKREALAVLKLHNVFYFMPIGSMYGRHGITDIVAVVNGMGLFIEVKSADGEVRPLQDLFMTAAQKAGAYAMVFRPGDARMLEHRINAMRSRTWEL